MRNDNTTFFLVAAFVVLAATTKISMFFLIAFFFVARMLLKSNKSKQRDNRQDRSQRRPKEVYRDRSAPTNRQSYQKRSNPFKKSGIRKYKEFELEDAIIDFKKGLEINNKDIALHFNIACAYSLTEQKEKAFDHVKKAVQNGFKDFEKIQTHDDLAFMRIQPEYEAFKKSGFSIIGEQVGEENKKKTTVTPDQAQDDVLLSQLNKLAELRKKGLLSEQEFAYERKKLLSR